MRRHFVVQHGRMLVHHVNAALMNPPFLSGLVAHVLVVEHSRGLVLVDTGFGRADHRDPSRLGSSRLLLRPDPDDSSTAAGAVEALGHSVDDVTDIVLTHLDLDHVGGLADFPGARVHTTAQEHAAALPKPSLRDRARYRPVQLDHGVRWQIHEGPGDAWRDGLTGIEVLPGITMVPMPGHTRGHTAVAVDSDHGLLVHAGDAVFDASVYTDVSPSGAHLTPIRLLRLFEKVMAVDAKRIAANHAALARLHGQDGVTVFPAHDERMLSALQGQH